MRGAAITLAIVLVVSGGGPLPVLGQTQLLSDVGFESGSVPLYAGLEPICTSGWCGADLNGPIELVGSPVHGGALALRWTRCRRRADASSTRT